MSSKRSINFLQSMLVGKRIPGYWSVSAYETYNSCPARYALSRVVQYCLECGSTEGKKYVGGVKRCKRCNAGPKSIPAIERGTEIHSKAEHYLKGGIKRLPDELENFSKEFANLRSIGAEAEAQWTLTARGETCEPTDWDRAWLRMKIDTHVYDEEARHVTIIDYKTGREKPQEIQAEVYGWTSPYYYPDLKTASVEFWWTNTGNVTNVPVDRRGNPKVWTRKELSALEDKWRERAKKMLADRIFAATPGPKCQYCDYRSSNVVNGRRGPCEAWRQGG